MTDTFLTLLSMADDIHARNVKAGWWGDLATGESIVATRNRGELLMLAITEIAEAYEGIRGEPDDKLPHYPMFHVELADCAIRVLDILGVDSTQQMRDDAACRVVDSGSRTSLMDVVGTLSDAMEGFRKNNTFIYVNGLVNTLGLLTMMSTLYGGIEYDFLTIVREKLEFNANRADHKIENRRADGGKKC